MAFHLALLLFAGAYTYTRDLLALEKTGQGRSSVIDPALRRISSPLSIRMNRWRGRLSGHPEQTFVAYVLRALEHGFQVGYQGGEQLDATA